MKELETSRYLKYLVETYSGLCDTAIREINRCEDSETATYVNRWFSIGKFILHDQIAQEQRRLILEHNY